MPYTIVNQFLSVAASAHGAELQSIIGSNGTEYPQLHFPKSYLPSFSTRPPPILYSYF